MNKPSAFGARASVFASLLALCSCAADAALDKGETLGAADEVRLGGAAQDLGTLTYGETRSFRYANPPTLRAYRFRAAAGDRADVWVRSSTGDAMVWLTDRSRNIVAANDDADASTLDAHLTVTLRAAGEYTLFVRDYHRQSHPFTVSLGGGPDFFSCRADGDCASVSRGGCCTGWQRVAVNASRADAYAAANVRRPPYPPCAPPPADLEAAQAALVPVCNVERGQCQLVAPADIRCGGRSPTARTCPAGYLCQGRRSSTTGWVAASAGAPRATAP